MRVIFCENDLNVWLMNALCTYRIAPKPLPPISKTGWGFAEVFCTAFSGCLIRFLRTVRALQMCVSPFKATNQSVCANTGLSTDLLQRRWRSIGDKSRTDRLILDNWQRDTKTCNNTSTGQKAYSTPISRSNLAAAQFECFSSSGAVTT